VEIASEEDLSLHNRTVISKRDQQTTSFWELSQISTPREGFDWYKDERIRGHDRNTNGVGYNYFYHESSGEGQYIYVVENGIWENHPVFLSLYLSLSLSLVLSATILQHHPTLASVNGNSLGGL
jgi:hypothetical protein